MLGLAQVYWAGCHCECSSLNKYICKQAAHLQFSVQYRLERDIAMAKVSALQQTGMAACLSTQMETSNKQAYLVSKACSRSCKLALKVVPCSMPMGMESPRSAVPSSLPWKCTRLVCALTSNQTCICEAHLLNITTCACC